MILVYNFFLHIGIFFSKFNLVLIYLDSYLVYTCSAWFNVTACALHRQHYSASLLNEFYS